MHVAARWEKRTSPSAIAVSVRPPLRQRARTFGGDVSSCGSDGYDETFTASQDYELWSRLSERHALANLPQRLVTLRVLETSITSTHKRPELIRSVQASHFQRLFARPAKDAELDLIALFRTRVAPERLREFCALIEELAASTEAAWPGIGRTPDFRRTLALIHERTGYNLLTLSRGAGLGEILRVLRAWPPMLFAMPWWRIAALAVLGDTHEGSMNAQRNEVSLSFKLRTPRSGFTRRARFRRC